MNLKKLLVFSLLYLVVSGQMAQVNLDHVGTTLEGLKARNKLIKTMREKSHHVQETAGNLWESVDSVMETLDQGQNTEDLAKKKIEDIKDCVKGQACKIASQGKSVVEDLKGGAAQTLEALQDFPNEIANWFTDTFFGPAKKHAEPTLKEKAMNAASDLKDSAKEKLQQASDFVKENAEVPLKETAEKLQEQAKFATDWISHQTPEVLKDLGEKIKDELAHAKDAAESLKDSASEKLGEATDFIKDHIPNPLGGGKVGDKLKSAGRSGKTGTAIVDHIPNPFAYRTKNPETGEIWGEDAQKNKKKIADPGPFYKNQIPESVIYRTDDLMRHRAGGDELFPRDIEENFFSGPSDDLESLQKVKKLTGDATEKIPKTLGKVGEKLKKKASNAADEIKDSFSHAGDSIKKTAEKAADYIKDHIPDSLHGAKQKLQETAEDVSGFVQEKIPNSFGEVTEELRERAGKLKDKIPTSLGDAGIKVKKGAADKLKEGLSTENIKDMGHKFGDKASNFASELKGAGEKLMKKAQKTAGSTFDDMKESIGDAGVYIKENAVDSVEWVKAHTPESLKNAGEKVRATGKSVLEQAMDAASSTGDKLSEATQYVKDKIPTLDETKEKLHDAASYVKDKIPSYDEAKDMATEKYGQATDSLRAAKDNLQQRAADAASYVKDKVPSLDETKEKLNDAASYVKDKVPSFDEAKEGLRAAKDKIQEKATDAAKTIKDAVPESLGDAKEKLHDAASYMKDKVEQVPDLFGAAMRDNVLHAAEWIKEHTPGSIDEAKDKINTAASFVKEHTPEPILSAGRWVKHNTPSSLSEAQEKLSDAAEFIRHSTPKPVIAAGEAIQEGVWSAADWIKENTPESLEDAKEKLRMAAEFIKRPTEDLDYNEYPNSYEKKHEDAASTIKRTGRGTTEESDDVYKTKFSKTGEQLKEGKGVVEEAAEKVVEETKKSWADRTKSAMNDMKEAAEDTLADAAAYVEGHTPKVIKNYGEKLKEEVEHVWEKAKEKVHGGEIPMKGKDEKKSDKKKLKDGQPDIAESDEERKYQKVTSDGKQFDPKNVNKNRQPKDLPQ